MTDHTTTVRIPTTSILDSIRNVNNAIACLALRRANNGFLTKEQHADLADLHKKLDRLNREYDERKRLLEAQQRATANNDPLMQRTRANIIRR
jgi:hypothetical protein